jgi:hypothetical protein
MVSSYDIFPLDAMTDKQRMLEEAAEEQQIFFFEHVAYTECCLVEKSIINQSVENPSVLRIFANRISDYG